MLVALSAASEAVDPAVISAAGTVITLGGLLLTALWLVRLFRSE